MVRLFSVCLLLPLLLSCAPPRWWGEAAPSRPIVQKLSDSESCADPATIFTAPDEDISLGALRCWRSQLDALWKDVNGSEKEALSLGEIELLLKEDVIKFSGDRKALLEKLESLKRLLGFGGKITRAGVEEWIGWVERHRGSIRELHFADRWFWAEYRMAGEILSSFLKKMDFSAGSEELSFLIRPLIPESHPELRKASLELSRAFIDLFGMVCPTLTRSQHWNTRELAACLDEVQLHFYTGEEWFNFLLHIDFADPQRDRISRALDRVALLVADWFEDPRLTGITTQYWIDLGNALGLGLSDHALDQLKWIRKFDSKSTERHIHPSFAVMAFDVIRDYQQLVLGGYHYFRHCEQNPDHAWSECIPGFESSSEPYVESMGIALRMRNLNYGNAALPLNGALFKKLMLYYAASGQLMKVFDRDPKDGYIRVSDKAEADEVASLISTGFSFIKNIGVIENLLKRLQNQPVPRKVQPVYETFDTQGLAQLVTLIGDTVTRRTKAEKMSLDREIEEFAKDLAKNITQPVPQAPLYLDRVGLAGVIAVVDTLSSYREAYLDPAKTPMAPEIGFAAIAAGEGDTEPMIRRGAVLRALPQILKTHFPRTYESCKEFGFVASCGIAFNEIIPDSDESDNPDARIGTGNLDIITLIGIYTEGLLDYCDSDGNGVLSWSILDGDDELDCGFVRLKDTAKRLMKADIIEDTPTTRSLLEQLNSFSFTRHFGKAAMVRGSRKLIGVKGLKFWGDRSATIGSILGLLSESIASDELQRWKKAEKARSKAEKRREKKKREQERARRSAPPTSGSRS